MDPMIGGGGGRRKRRRRGEDGSDGEGEEGFKEKDLTEVLMTSLAMEQQEKAEEAAEERAAEEERAMFEARRRKMSQALMEFRSDSETHFRDLNEDETNRRKRSRAASAAVVSAVVGGAQEEVGKGKNAGAGTATSQHRRLWVKDRSNSWWDECCKPDFPEEEFKREFRMGKETFDLICEELKSHVAKEDTTLRNTILVPQRVVVCIWRLATGEPLRVVSKKFGLGISTCHKLVLEVCSAIKTVLMPKYLQWPDEETARSSDGVRRGGGVNTAAKME